MTQGRKEKRVSYRLSRLRCSVIQERWSKSEKILVEKVTVNLWTWPWRKRWKQTNKRKEGPRWTDVTPRKTTINFVYGLPTLEKSIQSTNWKSPESVVMENAVKMRKGPSIEPIKGYHWHDGQAVTTVWLLARVWYDKGSCPSSILNNSLVARQSGIVTGTVYGFEKVVMTKENIMRIYVGASSFNF